MVRFSILIAGFVLASCTERNKFFCGDGFCIDAAFPYCDIDGNIGGTPGACVAVECTPGELELCRGDIAVNCNVSGDNFDDTMCPLGCDVEAGGCRQCTDSAQCDAAAPICDAASSSCRQCEVDDECASRVCNLDSGACVLEASIVYASPAEFGSCSLAQPCPIDQAVTLAGNASVTPIIRMLPGTYTRSLTVDLPTATPLQVVASGATIAVIGPGTSAIEVTSGASVEIRGIETTSEKHIQCGVASSALSSLVVRGASLRGIGNATRIEARRCSLTLREVQMFGGNTVFGMLEDATLDADRVHIHGPELADILLTNADRSRLTIANSLFEQTQIISFQTSAVVVGPIMTFAHTTFLLPQTLRVCEDPTVNHTLRFENSIFVAQGAFDAFRTPNPADCTFTSTLLSRQITPPAGTFVADPKFVNQVSRDFHLAADSPAIDVAVPASITSNHDLDGVARPQGIQSDIGAYEHQP